MNFCNYPASRTARQPTIFCSIFCRHHVTATVWSTRIFKSSNFINLLLVMNHTTSKLPTINAPLPAPNLSRWSFTNRIVSSFHGFDLCQRLQPCQSHLFSLAFCIHTMRRCTRGSVAGQMRTQGIQKLANRSPITSFIQRW